MPARRSLHEGRSVLNVSLGKHDHVIQVRLLTAVVADLIWFCSCSGFTSSNSCTHTHDVRKVYIAGEQVYGSRWPEHRRTRIGLSPRGP